MSIWRIILGILRTRLVLGRHMHIELYKKSRINGVYMIFTAMYGSGVRNRARPGSIVAAVGAKPPLRAESHPAAGGTGLTTATTYLLSVS